jgi:hypothetical protein
MTMRKWFRGADADDIKMVLSGAVAVVAFAVFVLVWSIDNYRRAECERGSCSTIMSAQRAISGG